MASQRRKHTIISYHDTINILYPKAKFDKKGQAKRWLNPMGNLNPGRVLGLQSRELFREKRRLLKFVWKGCNHHGVLFEPLCHNNANSCVTKLAGPVVCCWFTQEEAKPKAAPAKKAASSSDDDSEDSDEDSEEEKKPAKTVKTAVVPKKGKVVEPKKKAAKEESSSEESSDDDDDSDDDEEEKEVKLSVCTP